MFPIHDENPTLDIPFITYFLIATNVLVWITVQGFGNEPALSRSVCELGAVPGELLGTVQPGLGVPISPNTLCVVDARANWLTPLTSMFLHGGWFHIISNMWFLAVFGNNVEDSMGRMRFVVFYLLCGFAAVAAQMLANPASPVPMVGASGAIGGVMGAYAVLYPRAPVHMLIFLGFFVTRAIVPAALMLGYWILLQLLGAIPKVGGATGGVAFWAHIGGFAAGIILIFIFRNPQRVASHRALVANRLFKFSNR
jgi:membrane associated rhomboid family serine protease